MNVRIAAAAAAVVIAASACSHAPNVAAESTDFVLKEEQVQQTMDACKQLDLSIEGGRQSFVTALVRAEIADGVLRQEGQQVDEHQAKKMLAEGVPVKVDPNNPCLRVNWSNVMFQMYPEAFKGLKEYLSSLDVQLNPRYGNWSYEELSASGNGSISTLAQHQ